MLGNEWTISPVNWSWGFRYLEKVSEKLLKKKTANRSFKKCRGVKVAWIKGKWSHPISRYRVGWLASGTLSCAQWKDQQESWELSQDFPFQSLHWLCIFGVLVSPVFLWLCFYHAEHMTPHPSFRGSVLRAWTPQPALSWSLCQHVSLKLHVCLACLR